MHNTVKSLRERISEPSLSFWVSASAGTGKTYQLTQRAVGLLLKRCDPEKLLCLTHTRNAAAQMRERIFAELAALTKTGSDKERRRATHLLIDCIEAGNGLRVMTIHSFCEELLQRFPLEAGVSERFEVADDAQAQMLERQTLNRLIAERRGDETLKNCLDLLVRKNKNFKDLKGLIRAALEYPFEPIKPPKDAQEEEKNSYALAYVAKRFREQFERQKRLNGVLTFEDLIDKATELLEKDNGLSWVNYKLDSRIEHILLDEAQDTSPKQWRVVRALAGDFFSGEGARDAKRSIFVVGDEKQSIYGFQGADLAELGRIRLALRREAGERWREESLTENRRSPSAILSFVDGVFGEAKLAAAISSEGEIKHSAAKGNANNPAVIEIEEPFAKNDGQASEPEWRLADHIATKVKKLLDAKLAVPEEIMILLQERGKLMDPITFALKKQGIKVLSDDNKPIHEHLCIMDLAAVGRFCLYPNDDYNLACLLKSPLLDGSGINEETLWRLLYRRRGSLWRAVREDEALAKQIALLTEYLAIGGRLPPFEFYMRVLGGGGENRLLANVSEAERETVNIFINKALSFEKLMPTNPSLIGFLDWLQETEQLPPSSEGSSQQGFVRVTTVHRAKGLEAAVVILADAAKLHKAHQARVLFAAGEKRLLYAHKKGDWDERFTELAAKKEENEVKERQRLLYVAFTRSKNRLIITGSLPAREAKKNPPFPSWHCSALTAVKSEAEETRRGSHHQGCNQGDSIYRLAIGEMPRKTAAELVQSPGELPNWAEPPSSPPASGKNGDGLPTKRGLGLPQASPLAEESQAKQLGKYIHKLLEVLPETPEEQRREVAEQLMTSHHLSDEEFASCYGRAISIIKRFAWIFAGENSTAEREFILKHEGRWRRGRIDRLVVATEGVTVVDFKSGSRKHLPNYLEQLHFYHAAIKHTWGGRVRSGILWTDEPNFELMLMG